MPWPRLLILLQLIGPARMQSLRAMVIKAWMGRPGVSTVTYYYSLRGSTV